MGRVIAVKNVDGIELVDLETVRFVRIAYEDGELVISAEATPEPMAAILEIVERYFSIAAAS